MRLHEVLNLTRPMLGIDLETTGVDAQTSGIVEIGIEIMAPGQPVQEYRTLVNPLLNIPKEATAVHGITNEMVQDAPTFLQLSDNLFSAMQGCDFAGYNVRFDLRQFAAEFKRAAKDWDYQGARIIDGYRIWQLAEGRTLEHAVERWLVGSQDVDDQAILANLESDGHAHNALWDVKMSTRIIAAQLSARPNLPRDLDALHELQWPGYFDSEGKLRWREDGELGFSFGAHSKLPMSLVPRGYLQWVIKSDFSDEVKQACREVLGGKIFRRQS